jgi:hypothetical protein
MNGESAALWLIEQETRSLAARLASLRPFSLTTPMVPAATVSPAAATAMENHLLEGRRLLRGKIGALLEWLKGSDGRRATPAEAQTRLVFLKLRFNAVISQFYIFAAVLTQRSESGTGVWVAGLDDLAMDALALPGGYYRPPPVVCFLDRGHGGAIRRARTRLPGGDLNPIAIIRIPQERMVGAGIASSLVHETGHQAAELLGLLGPLRGAMQERQKARPAFALAWRLLERWISEIAADFWGVAKVGMASTLGLIGLVSLPRVFVFRITADDPHPAPWIRVKLSCAMGDALYPHPQWSAIARLWESLYPATNLSAEVSTTLSGLEAVIPEFVQLLVNIRPPSLRGRSLKEVMPLAERRPAALVNHYRRWAGSPELMRAAPPTLVFAAIGQARVDGKISPEAESKVLSDLLSYWAMRSALDTLEICATQPKVELVQEPPSLRRRTQLTLQ